MKLTGTRLGWALVFVAAVALIAVAASRDAGPRTPDERIQAISERIACPVCQGESVADSRNPTSEALRERIKIDVRAGQMTDDEIIDSITSARDGQELLVPTANGVEALAWALPAAAFVVGVMGLGLAFGRWRREAASVGGATEQDYELVAAALTESAVGGGRDRPAAGTAPRGGDRTDDERTDTALTGDERTGDERTGDERTGDDVG